MINGRKEFTDIVSEEEFRKETFGFLQKELGLHSYEVPDAFPPLYKYRRLSDYAIDDIVNTKFTATSIGAFNDVFDGTMHAYGNAVHRADLAQKDWETIEALVSQCGFPGLLPRDEYVKSREAYYKQDSRGKFRLPEYLGTYVFCLSKNNDSILMWAHYAGENTGICIEYDFNTLPETSLVRKCIFPVVYSSTPIDVLPLIDKKPTETVKYPYDTATLCVAVNKAQIWNYEEEWRFIEINTREKRQRISRESIKPTRIIFGSRFLKPLFYYLDESDSMIKERKQHFDRLIRLLDYMIQEGIGASVACPVIGNYKLVPRDVSAVELKRFLFDKFAPSKGKEMRFYHVVADALSNLIMAQAETVNAQQMVLKRG